MGLELSGPPRESHNSTWGPLSAVEWSEDPNPVWECIGWLLQRGDLFPGLACEVTETDTSRRLPPAVREQECWGVVVQSGSQGQKPGVLMSEGGGRWTPQLRLRAECPSSAVFFSSGPRGLDDAHPRWSGRPPPAVQLFRASLSFRHTQKGCSPAIWAPCGPVKLTHALAIAVRNHYTSLPSRLGAQ